MKIKSLLAKPLATLVVSGLKKRMATAVVDQNKTLRYLVSKALTTEFGQDHDFLHITQAADFAQKVPIRDYEELKPYIEKVKNGAANVLWPGQPIYFAKTSGTTSGAKYIPITKDSMPSHIATARNALLCYIAETGNADFVDGNMIFLSGSPVLDSINGIHTGRLSGIVNHHVPNYLRGNQLPSYSTNCIEDWESKLSAIVSETKDRNMTLVSGIPPWMQMYIDKLIEVTGKKPKELFPSLSLIIHGGVNFEPYKAKLFDTLGFKPDTIETFPASEGFFAFQDSQREEGLLLNTWSGMYFEFVPSTEIFNEEPKRLTLGEVQLGVNYALIVSSNAGLWAYNIGDTVKFVSLNPFRIVVTGRIKHFISAFGEHVIAEEVEHALLQVAKQFNVRITEFTVAPAISAHQGKSYHEWFIEFENEPESLSEFSAALDHAMRLKNIYYNDLVSGQILQPLVIRPLRKNAFIDYMKSIGKLGGQNKVPRLSNDRKIAAELMPFC